MGVGDLVGDPEHLAVLLEVPSTSSKRNGVTSGVTPSTSGVVTASRVWGRRNLTVWVLFFGIGLMSAAMSSTITGSADSSIFLAA